MIFAVDAGCTVSSFVIFDSKTQALVDKGLDVPNDELLLLIARYDYSVFAFERIASFGFPVGKEVLDTAEWNGRFRHAAEIRKGVTVYPITRKQIVVFFTGKATGGDAAVRAAMRERHGADVVKTCTYDQTSALAIATFASDHLGGGFGNSDHGRTLPKNKADTPPNSLLPVPCAGRPNDSVCDAAEDRTARESTIAKDAVEYPYSDSRGGRINLSGGLNAGHGVPGATKARQPAQSFPTQVSATS